MDETSRGAEPELAVSAEQPIEHRADDSLHGRRRLRRRRATRAAALSAGVVIQAAVVVSIVLALTSGAGRQASRPRLAAAPETGTAYVASGLSVFPISLATSTVGTPIGVPEGINDAPFIPDSAISRDGRTIYEVGLTGGVGSTVTPIDTATNTARPTITIQGAVAEDFALAPNGKAAYLSSDGALYRISTGTNTVSRVLLPYQFESSWPMAFSPNGKTLYVVTDGKPRYGGRRVTAIQTATNTVLANIEIPASSPGGPFNIAITPNGKTAYVVDAVWNAEPGQNSVVPINLATNTALTPIKIPAPRIADGLVIAPDGRTAYVLSPRAVTPINTATNQAEATINLPASPANAYYMVIAPNGKRLYVISTHGVVPIRTATGTVLPTIKVPYLYAYDVIAITPDSRTIYVGAQITKGVSQVVLARGVVPISTATGAVGHFINLGGDPFSITFAP